MKLKIFLAPRFNFIIFIFLANGLWPESALSQDMSHDYAPIKNYSPSFQMVIGYERDFLRWSSKVEFENTGAKTAFFNQTKKLGEIVGGLDSLKLLMYNDTLTHFINSIKDTIVKYNPELQKREYHIFILRSLEPNAFNFGEGLILFNLGLIERLKTVDEIAMVIGHELSHDYFNHLIHSMHDYYEKMFSKETKKEFRQTNRIKAYRRTALQNLFNAYQADFMRVSKSNELMADSMGLEFCVQAGYNVKASLILMDVLEDADDMRYHDTLPLEQIFNSDDYPFKSYWVEKENLAFVMKRDSMVGLTPDSLKTHPDCKQRRDALSNLAAVRNANFISDEVERSTYQTLNPLYQFEMLTSLIQIQEYPEALYTALHLQIEYPENLFLKYVVANVLIELSKLAAGNAYLEAVEFPDDRYLEGYNQILIFLQNLNSSSLQQLADQYIKSNTLDMEDHPYGAYLKIISNTEIPITSEVVVVYQAKFPEAIFDSLLMKKVLPEPVKTKK